MMQSQAVPFSLRAALVAGGLALVLSGCSDAKRALGFEKAPPDEFQVVERAPLSMPPDFSLRPPNPGAPRPQESTPRDEARATLLGLRQPTPISSVNRDHADMVLLKRLGADQIQVNIRDLVDKETQSTVDAGKSFTDKLVFWRKPEAAGDGEQLNATQEARRLSENQALGRSVTDGNSPRIERKEKGWLEGIF